MSEPVAIWYLKNLGVDVARDVRLVVATHWHDDHIKGLADTLMECRRAAFCCASVLTHSEFLATANVLNSNNSLKGGSGTREIMAVHELLNKDFGRSPSLRAIQNRLLWPMTKDEAEELRAHVWSLSPSDAEYELFLQRISSEMPGVRAPKYRIPSQGPNNTAVVLLVESEQSCALLGADLEERGDNRTGWAAVLSSRLALAKPAACFKVPHHGSINAHNDTVWSGHVASNALAVLTPYGRGRKRLPSVEDISRISGLTDRAYRAGRLSRTDARSYSNAVEKTIREAGVVFREYTAGLGVVRCRESLGPTDAWEVELFGDASKLGQ